MTNSKALYYPTIEIKDENWLKSSLLFWDEIRTIVPESISQPYSNKTTSILAERKILIPEIVNPDHSIVKEISETILEFLDTEEGQMVLLQNETHSRIHRDKISRIHMDKIGHKIERLLRLHPSKLSHELRYLLEDELTNGWLMVNSSFAIYYMTMLANKLCEDTGYTLLTNNAYCANLSDKVRLGIKRPNRDINMFRPNHLNQQLANGIFLNLLIERIDFHPSTNIIDILSFKEDHKDELGIFRTNIKKMLKDVKQDSTVKALKEEIKNIYHDEFIPSYNNLKKSLTLSGFKFSINNMAKIAFFSIGATSIPLQLGLTVPQALLAGTGISLIASAITYNVEKKNKLRENPYNYLLNIEQNL